jgi:hypothetical protein
MTILLILISPLTYMEDPTGGMWIYFIFFLFPLVRILPRLMRKLKAKNAGKEQPQESYQQEPKKERSWMPKFERESFFEEEKTDKKDGWLSKGDFK